MVFTGSLMTYILYMGNIESSNMEGGGTEGKIKPVVKPRQYKLVQLNVPYKQLEMIKVLQHNFDYEVKGTIYFNDDHKFSSFAVRTDGSETYSYGEANWRICFHTHPDNTAQKYGVRYFSPPSAEDVLEIYEHSINYVPSSVAKSLGEISIVFASEGIYVLQVDRDNFAKFNKASMPIELLEVCLKETFTDFVVNHVKTEMQKIVQQNKPGDTVNMDNPQINLEEYQQVLESLSRTATEDYGFNMSYHSWSDLEKNGLDIKVYDYFVKKTKEL